MENIFIRLQVQGTTKEITSHTFASRYRPVACNFGGHLRIYQGLYSGCVFRNLQLLVLTYIQGLVHVQLKTRRLQDGFKGNSYMVLIFPGRDCSRKSSTPGWCALAALANCRE